MSPTREIFNRLYIGQTVEREQVSPFLQADIDKSLEYPDTDRAKRFGQYDIYGHLHVWSPRKRREAEAADAERIEAIRLELAMVARRRYP